MRRLRRVVASAGVVGVGRCRARCGGRPARGAAAARRAAVGRVFWGGHVCRRGGVSRPRPCGVGGCCGLELGSNGHEVGCHTGIAAACSRCGRRCAHDVGVRGSQDAAQVGCGGGRHLRRGRPCLRRHPACRAGCLCRCAEACLGGPPHDGQRGVCGRRSLQRPRPSGRRAPGGRCRSGRVGTWSAGRVGRPSGGWGSRACWVRAAGRPGSLGPPYARAWRCVVWLRPPSSDRSSAAYPPSAAFFLCCNRPTVACSVESLFLPVTLRLIHGGGCSSLGRAWRVSPAAPGPVVRTMRSAGRG